MVITYIISKICKNNISLSNYFVSFCFDMKPDTINLIISGITDLPL